MLVRPGRARGRNLRNFRKTSVSYFVYFCTISQKTSKKNPNSLIHSLMTLIRSHVFSCIQIMLHSRVPRLLYCGHTYGSHSHSVKQHTINSLIRPDIIKLLSYSSIALLICLLHSENSNIMILARSIPASQRPEEEAFHFKLTMSL